jgi:hypothetical protein
VATHELRLLLPELRTNTGPAFLGAGLIYLLGGLLVLFYYIKQRRDSFEEKPLSADERRRAEDLLASLPGKERL